MERMAEVNVPTWAEEPALAFSRMRIYLRMDKDYDLDKERQKHEQREGRPRKSCSGKSRRNSAGGFRPF